MSVTTTFISNTPTPAQLTDVGINVSKPGFNALSTSGSNLVYSSTWPTLQYPFEVSVTGTPMPNTPYKFSAYLNSAQNSVNGTVLINLNAVLFDTGSNFNTSTHLFTAPISGYYQFNYSVTAVSTTPTTWQAFIEKNGATIMSFGSLFASTTSTQSNGSREIQLSINDTLGLYLEATGVQAIQDLFSTTYLEGFLVST